MARELLLDINPNTFALIVASGMALIGFTLGTALDRIMLRLEIRPDPKGRLR